jgi:hypothetical protein
MAHSLIASDRVEGTPVVQASTGNRMGSIQRLMIDKLSGNVAYAVLSFGGFLGLGEKHFPVPWAALKYSTRWGAYALDMTEEQLSGAPQYTAGEEIDWGDRHQDSDVGRFYHTFGY